MSGDSREGWFDAVGVRHAVRINGLTGIALTKLDVLTGFKKLKVCTAYKSGGEIYHDFPASVRVLPRLKAPVCVPPRVSSRPYEPLPIETVPLLLTGTSIEATPRVLNWLSCAPLLTKIAAAALP